jgi:hypothetical protein
MMAPRSGPPKGALGVTFKATGAASKLLAKMRPFFLAYNKAFKKSREAKRPVSFRVDVEPDGTVSAVPVVETSTESAPFPVEEVDSRSPELERALAAARERGVSRAAEILSGKDMLSADAFADLLGVSRVTVNTK